jgi:hypothetical protein
MLIYSIIHRLIDHHGFGHRSKDTRHIIVSIHTNKLADFDSYLQCQSIRYQSHWQRDRRESRAIVTRNASDARDIAKGRRTFHALWKHLDHIKTHVMCDQPFSWLAEATAAIAPSLPYSNKTIPLTPSQYIKDAELPNFVFDNTIVTFDVR